MRKFEVGKRYYNNGITYEIVKRTATRVTYKKIQHAGRFNERIIKINISLQNPGVGGYQNRLPWFLKFEKIFLPKK